MITDPLEAAVLVLIVLIVLMTLRLVYQVYEIQCKRRKEPSIEDADRELEFDAMEMWEKEFAWKPQPSALPARALPQLDPMMVPAPPGAYMYNDWLVKQMAEARNARSYANLYGYDLDSPRTARNAYRQNKPRRTSEGWQHAHRDHQRNPYNPRLTFSDYLIGMEQDPAALFQQVIDTHLTDYPYYQ